MNYYWTFVVEGSGKFPLDMLRYDRCCPFQQEDVNWMESEGRRSAMMLSYKGPPTVERWRSFGWTVDLIKKDKR